LASDVNEGLEMPGMDATMGTLTVPIWAAGAASALFVVAVILAIGKAGATAAIATLFRVAVVAIAVSAGYIYMQRSSLEDQRSSLEDRMAERRSLDERSAALMGRAIAPGSALSCLDELAGETVEAACEKAVFATPEAVAAAVSYVTAKLSLLADGTQYAERDTPYAAELVPLRAAIELDRFGIVAHVLAQREGCTVEQCDPLSRLHDSSRVFANLRDRTFEEQVTKHMASWISPSRAASGEGPAVAAVAPVAPPAMVPANPTPAPATVSPRYDFPSAQSIPPVNIMAPEPAAPRPAPSAPAQVPADANGQAAVTPVPPRRPPQVRAPAVPPRPAALRPEPPPAAIGDTLAPAPPPVR
jgi:hypothetical protein